MFYLLKKDKKYCFVPAKGTFHIRERSGSVVGCLTRGFEPHRHHCVVVLEQDTFILA